MKKFFITLIVLVVLGTGAYYALPYMETFFEPEEPLSTTTLPIVDDESVVEDTEPQELILKETTITLNDGSDVTFELAEPFDIAVAAEGLGKVRFMAMSSDKRLFVPDMVNYNLAHTGKLHVLEDFNEETLEFETINTYLSGLRGPNSVAFYTDKKGQEWLYLALTKNLIRYPYEQGDLEPSDEGEIVAEFPNKQSPGEESVVWHITRTIFFHNDRVYVSVGSGCNSCEQLAGDMRAMIYSMKPDGSDERVEGDGLRNTVGIGMAEGELYATANGVDHLGQNAPEEMFYKIERGENYGWPYCYAQNGKMVPDTSQDWDTPLSCDEVPSPLTTFAPHTAPLGLKYFEKAHKTLEGTFLVALHGAFKQEDNAPPEIIRVTKDGEKGVFMTGFELKDGSRTARPVDFLQVDENSFFFTDDHAGRIYYVYAQ